MGRYRVFYEQIDSTYFDVSANNKDEAVEKARKLWCKFLEDCKEEESTEVDRIR